MSAYTDSTITIDEARLRQIVAEECQRTVEAMLNAMIRAFEERTRFEVASPDGKTVVRITTPAGQAETTLAVFAERMKGH